MAIASATELADALRRHRLLSPPQTAELARLQTAFPDPRLLARQLMQLGWLTAYQVNQLLAGRGADLVLGPYLLLERLGEGGNGQVFKARKRDTQQVVALKVLRPELLEDPEVVLRFKRESDLVQRIAHPNIVHAYEAGPVGSTLALAMEYVDGVDLARLVKDSGPLPIAQAAEYIRQAACGLAHAHERGLIHRDIKPSNLLLQIGAGTSPGPDLQSTIRNSRSATVKIVDLGLARLQQPALDSSSANLTVLTGNGIMQGTPDYMAPEQALDLHGADHRADIYSLGCSFYFLLTGNPPFPGGSVTHKLMAHQGSEPYGMRALQERLPPELLTVLKRMLAKQPQDRYASAAQIAAALAPFSDRAPDTGKTPMSETVVQALRSEALPTATPIGGRRRRVALWLAGAALVLLTVALFFLFRGSGTPRSTQVAARNTGGSVTPEVGRGPLVTIAGVSSGRPYDIGTASLGTVYWIDRPYTITNITPALDGGTLVRGANDDKKINNPAHLTLSLGMPAIVYIAYDKRGTRLPAWLDDGTWQLTNEVLTASGGDVAASPMRVYAKRFPAGSVVLGGNRQAPAAGATTNYLVILKPLAN